MALDLIPATTRQLVVAQCTAEATPYLGTGERSAVLNWCTIQNVASRAPGASRSLVIKRVLRTHAGTVDCASRPRRCVVAVRVGGLDSTDDRSAPLTFRSLSPLPTGKVRLDGVTGPIADGQSITVVGEDYPPSVAVSFTECISVPGTPVDASACDYTRTPRSTRTDKQGRFRASFFAFKDVQLQRGERLAPWHRCEPCTLRVGLTETDEIDLALKFTSGAADVHPEVRIVQPGPYRPDQRVALTGTGFQANQDLLVEWCRLDSPQQDCALPNAVFGLKADSTGRFTLPSYLMPPRRFGAYGSTCLGAAARCALSWHANEGSPSAFTTPFQMSG